jgi:hypothetical protein
VEGILGARFGFERLRKEQAISLTQLPICFRFPSTIGPAGSSLETEFAFVGAGQRHVVGWILGCWVPAPRLVKHTSDDGARLVRLVFKQLSLSAPCSDRTWRAKRVV